MTEPPKSILEIDTVGAFITEMPDLGTVRTQSTLTKISFSPRRLPTKLGIVGEINVINGLFEKMRAKTPRINPDSPRTKQALSNLGIVKEECIAKKYSDFQTKAKSEKMKKMLYIYYIGYVHDTIALVLKERDKIRRKKERRSSLEMCPIGGFLQADKIAPATTTARTHFAHMDFETKLERLDANKQNEIHLIEKKAMTFLESERDYIKMVEKFNFKQERAERNKKLLDGKKLKQIEERNQRYSESPDPSQKLFTGKDEIYLSPKQALLKSDKEYVNKLDKILTKQERAEKNRKILEEKKKHKNSDFFETQKLFAVEEETMRRSSNPLVASARNYKENFQAEKLSRIAQHRQQEQRALEERKRIEMRIEQKNNEDMFRSTSALGQFLRKDLHSNMVLEREQNKKKVMAEQLKEKYNRTREHVRSATFGENPELYTRYGEKMRRFQNDMEKIEKERAKKLQEKKAIKEEQRQKVEENLQVIERDFNLREELLEEKLFSQTERMDKFYTSRQQFWDQKADLGKFKNQRSQIHFGKIRASDNRKCNIIMAKNKVWKEACEQKQKEKDMLRDTCMQNHWNVQAEKDSLNYYLDQVNKIHARTDLIAGRLRKVNTTFNVQNMANYISKNFNTAPPQQNGENQKEA